MNKIGTSRFAKKNFPLIEWKTRGSLANQVCSLFIGLNFPEDVLNLNFCGLYREKRLLAL